MSSALVGAGGKGVGQPAARRLGVLTRRVVDAADWWFASECGVASMVVVGVQEVAERLGALAVCGVGPDVGPFLGQGAVEAFDFAVGLGSVGPGVFARRADLGQGVLPGQAFAVGHGVVGQDAFDAVDAVFGVEGCGSQEESGAGGGFLVGVDLGVGQAGVVVDGGQTSAATDRRRRERPRTRMIGVQPRRDQVRAIGGVIENPASSSKTSHAPSAAQMFPRPAKSL